LRESLSLSPPKVKHSLVKGTREAPPFHKPLVRKACCGSAHLSQANAVPPTGERLAVIAHLSLTMPPPRRLWKRLAKQFAIALPLVRARGRALRNGLHAEREQSIGSAIGEEPSGGLANEIAFALPEGIHSPTLALHWLCPKASTPRRLLAFGTAFALPLGRAHAVLQCAPPCAHQRQGDASHKAKRFQRRRGGGSGRERIA